MAIMNFGGVEENVVTREEFPLEKAREVLKDEVIAVLGYGVQGPGQSLNLRDNGFNVIVGQRPGKTYDKAVADGWVPGETLFSIEEACERATIIQVLLSDAAQIQCWPIIKKHLTPGKALYFSHGFAITYSDRTHIVPPADVDVIMIAPKGSGTSLRRMFLQGRGLNSSYAIYQDATGKAWDRQSLMPLFGENGMDWMYANCSTTAQRGALDWMGPFHDAVKPVFEKLYNEVACGNEAQRSIDSNSQPDYREKLNAELKALHDSEMWRAGAVVRKLRPENN